TRQLRDEVRRRGELDVDLELVLQRSKLAHELVHLWLDADVTIDRGLPPTVEDGGRAAGQVDPNAGARDAAEPARARGFLARQPAAACPAARAKLTMRPTSAL